MSTVTNLLRKSWHFNRIITLAGVLHLLLIPAILVAMVVDPKVITGVNGWIKPLKFAMSGAIYGFTLAWLLTYIDRRRWLVQTIATVTGLVLILETALITMQVVRGVASHFNFSTAFDGAVFSTMGTAITILAIMNLLAVILLATQRMDNRVFATSLRLGALASLVGINVAFFMTAGPTPSQLAALEAGAEMSMIGAHSVGVEDGGPGLPFFGWSTEGGDLRVPHFIGLHGMQVIPLLGFLLTRRWMRRRFSEGQRMAFTVAAGVGYIGWTGLLTWQALRGQPIVAVDLWTGVAYVVLIGGVLAAISTALIVDGREPATVTA